MKKQNGGFTDEEGSQCCCTVQTEVPWMLCLHEFAISPVESKSERLFVD